MLSSSGQIAAEVGMERAEVGMERARILSTAYLL